MFGYKADHETRIKQGPVAAALPLIAAGLTAVSAAKSLFSKAPSAPQLPQAPAAPTQAQAQGSADEERRRQLLAKGRASTVLTGPEGLESGSAGLASRTLLP